MNAEQMAEDFQSDLIVGELKRMEKYEVATQLTFVSEYHGNPLMRAAAKLAFEKLVNEAMDNLGVPKPEDKPKYRWVNGARVRV